MKENLIDIIELVRDSFDKFLDFYIARFSHIIGVDFDYITLEPETANSKGGTTYLPYVFCVTANGNAVVIEKDDDK